MYLCYSINHIIILKICVKKNELKKKCQKWTFFYNILIIFVGYKYYLLINA